MLIPGRACAMKRVTGSNADRGGHIGGDTVPYSIGGDEGKGTGYVVLGTDLAGVVFSFNLLKLRLELGSTVVDEGLGITSKVYGITRSDKILLP